MECPECGIIKHFKLFAICECDLKNNQIGNTIEEMAEKMGLLEKCAVCCDCMKTHHPDHPFETLLNLQKKISVFRIQRNYEMVDGNEWEKRFEETVERLDTIFGEFEGNRKDFEKEQALLSSSETTKSLHTSDDYLSMLVIRNQILMSNLERTLDWNKMKGLINNNCCWNPPGSSHEISEVEKKYLELNFFRTSTRKCGRCGKNEELEKRYVCTCTLAHLKIDCIDLKELVDNFKSIEDNFLCGGCAKEHAIDVNYRQFIHHPQKMLKLEIQVTLFKNEQKGAILENFRIRLEYLRWIWSHAGGKLVDNQKTAGEEFMKLQKYDTIDDVKKSETKIRNLLSTNSELLKNRF